jgi:nitric oxide reductase NorQ protein
MEKTNSMTMETTASLDRPYYLPSGDEEFVFNASLRSNLPVLLKGPTGCGKTRLVQAIAHDLGRPLITVACHDDLSGADLVGRYLLQEGETAWMDGPLTRAVREGAICYLDEVVEARQDTVVVIHPLSDDRRILPIDRLGVTLAAHPDFCLVLSYNPGYQSALKDLKASTRQRFVTIDLDYPASEIETEIVAVESGCGTGIATDLVRVGGAIRRLEHVHLREVASTRVLVTAARLMMAGVAPRSAGRVAIANALADTHDLTAGLGELIDAYLPGRLEE